MPHFPYPTYELLYKTLILISCHFASFIIQTICQRFYNQPSSVLSRMSNMYPIFAFTACGSSSTKSIRQRLNRRDNSYCQILLYIVGDETITKMCVSVCAMFFSYTTSFGALFIITETLTIRNAFYMTFNFKCLAT